MTREPDRYDKQGDELACAYRTDRCPDLATHARQIAAALRAEHDGAVEQTAEWIRENAHRLLSGDELAEAILKRICPRDLQEDCSAPDGEIARCMDLTCPMKSPAAAPAAEPCRAECVSRMPDYSHYECTLPKGHLGPHKEGSFAEWTDATTVVAPSLLPRVLAALETEANAYRHRSFPTLANQLEALAAELRRYIADVEAPHPLSLRARVNYAEKRIAELEAALTKIRDRGIDDYPSRVARVVLAARTAARSEGEGK